MRERLLGKLAFLSRSSLQTRFLLRVLFPPFLILALIGVTGYVVMSVAVQNTAAGDLRRAAATTAAKLEREFALRKTVLRSTGNQMFTVDNDFRQKLAALGSDFTACQKFVKTDSHFVSAPGEVCKPFYAQFAIALQNGTSLTKAVSDGNDQQQTDLDNTRQDNLNQLLKSYVEFFPETSLVWIMNKSGEVTARRPTAARF